MKLSLNSLASLIYYTCLSAYIVIFCVSNSSFTEVYNFNPKLFSYSYWIIVVSLFVVFCLSFFLNKFKSSEFIYFIFFLFVAAVASIKVGNDLSILISVLLFLSARGRRIEKNIFCVFITYLSCAIIIVGSSLCGLIPNKEVFGVNPFKSGSVLKRHTYGFLQVNVLGVVLFVLFLCFFILYINRINLFFSSISLGFAFVLYFVINSKTAAFMIPLTCVIFLILSSIKRKSSLEYVSLVAFILMFLLSIFLVFKYNSNNNILTRINEILSNRISLAKEIYLKYKLSFVGQNIHLISTYQAKKLNLIALVLDNAYFHLMIRYGLLLTICFIVLFFIQVKTFSEFGLIKLLTVCIVLFICGISETWMLRTEINFTLLCILPCLNEKKNRGDILGQE